MPRSRNIKIFVIIITHDGNINLKKVTVVEEDPAVFRDLRHSDLVPRFITKIIHEFQMIGYEFLTKIMLKQISPFLL